MSKITLYVIAVVITILISSCMVGSPPGQQPVIIEPTATSTAATAEPTPIQEASSSGQFVVMIEEIPADLSETAQEYLAEGYQMAAWGDFSGMLIAFEEAESFAPDHELFNNPDFWERICRASILASAPDSVWTVCDRALTEARADTSDSSDLARYYELRGIAAALLGDTHGATADFEYYAGNAQDSEEVKIHESWIRILDDELPASGLDKPLPEEASRWNRACWFGSLRGLAPVVLPACELAVELADESQLGVIRDSRGVARALTGDSQGAIADFEFFVSFYAENEDYVEHLQRRRDWIEALNQGGEPFDQETLNVLASE